MKRILRYRSQLVVAIAAMFLLGSCGKDGRDGHSYIAVHDPSEYCYYFDSYTDNNTDLPTSFATGAYYATYPGTYDYDYYASSTCGYADVHCWGSYYIGPNYSGTSGGFFSSGKNGADRYYDLYCEYSGAVLDNYRLSDKPFTFDTTYVTNGTPFRVTGTIVREKMPAGFKAKLVRR